MADITALKTGDRNGFDMTIDEEVVNRVAALVWDTVSENWADDLARFSSHAGRQKVQLEDVALLTRRNPELFDAACKLAGVAIPHESEKNKPGRGKKRKNPESPPKPQKTELHTPKPERKKPANSKKLTTSTPKVERAPDDFPEEITPIRPNTQTEKLVTIEEVTLEDDSFDAPYVNSTAGTSKAPTNFSSLLKMAEEHVAEEGPTKQRLEAMVPEEEQYDDLSVESFDVFMENNKPCDRSLFKDKNDTDKTITEETSASTSEKKEPSKSNVFSSKMSAFGFDEDDSFDEPVAPSKPQTSTPPTFSKNTSKKNDSGKKNNSLLQNSKDSFDEFDFDI